MKQQSQSKPAELIKDSAALKLASKYRLMVYFAHSTLIIYSKTIVSDANMNVEQFREYNRDVVQRVFDEGLSLFNYQLSTEQIDRAISVYLQTKYAPSSVYETLVYKFN